MGLGEGTECVNGLRGRKSALGEEVSGLLGCEKQEEFLGFRKRTEVRPDHFQGTGGGLERHAVVENQGLLRITKRRIVLEQNAHAGVTVDAAQEEEPYTNENQQIGQNR